MKFKCKLSKDGLWWFSHLDKLDEQNDILAGFIRTRYVEYPHIRVFQAVLFKWRFSFGWKVKMK